MNGTPTASAKKRVVVVGGGVSGLTAARALAERAEVTLLEAQRVLGGNITTISQAGFTMDGGPDSWVSSKPHATRLANALGLASELIPTEEASRKVYIAQKGELLPLPDGLALGIPTKLWPIATTPLFSWDGKLRMALEPLIPPRAAEGDESIGEFFSRRLGDEITDKLIGPMLSGIYAGDPSELSIRATFPQFVEQEQKYGSLMRAMRHTRPPPASGEKRPSVFTSLKGGMRRLVEALAADVEKKAKIKLGAPVREVGREDGAWVVVTAPGERLVADEVIFAGPAHIASDALRAHDAELAGALGEIRYTSTATVFFALRREDVAHPLDGTGFLVPRGEHRAALAGTWVSSKWAHRAPPEHALVRVFFGGAGRESVVDLDDDELTQLAARELEALMGLSPRPVFTRIFRFRRANPQPTLGHLERVARVRRLVARWPGLHVVGSGFAIGIPDCVRLAEETAATIVAR